MHTGHTAGAACKDARPLEERGEGDGPIYAFVSAGTDRRIVVLGPLSSAHEETLQFVIERGEVAVADVAEHFWKETNMTAATNRLNTLAGMGLVVRRLERGGPRGNRYVYASIVTADAGGKSGNKPGEGETTR